VQGNYTPNDRAALPGGRIGFVATDESHDLREHICGREVIGLNEEIGMFTRVRKPAKLFEVVRFRPTHAAAGCADREGRREEYEDIGVSDSLPHVGNVRVLLRDVAAMVPLRLQGLHER